MGILLAVCLGFLIAGLAPALHRVFPRYSGLIITLLPLGLLAYFATLIRPVVSGNAITWELAWVPVLGLHLSFYVDGLSLLFALLISGVGAVVILYSSSYLSGHPQLGRFYCIILMFMASMLGLVLAGNLLALFVFWELTSVSSYFLIGFEHHREQARSSALQALLITGGGGLALLAGILLLGLSSGSFDLDSLLNGNDGTGSRALALPALSLILIGAFTKSAQVPFHFWLPNAMEAPTPVSAYLHSATMVNAGIYLLARLSPVFGDYAVWEYAVTAVGSITMVTGALMALGQTDLKRILAYTTVSKLGILTTLLGLGTELAVKAAVVVLLAHALYKAALFLVAGSIDHEAGTRSVKDLSGLRKSMPLTAIVGMLAAASMAAVPPTMGFIGKEKFYEATLEGQIFPALVTGAAILTSLLMVAAACVVGVRPFMGRTSATPKHPHEAPWQMWAGPVILAAGGFLLAAFPGFTIAPLLSSVVSAVLGERVEVKLELWSGFNLVLGLTVVTFLLGMLVYASRRTIPAGQVLPLLGRIGPERFYDSVLIGMNGVARLQTELLQNGYLRYYITIIIAATVGLVGFTLMSRSNLLWPAGLDDLRFHEVGIAALVVGAAIAAAMARSRLAAAAALGVTGYGVAVLFIFFGAPDLAMTQILIETLTVILFVLVFYHLPPSVALSRPSARLRDGVFAILAGLLMTGLVLMAATVQFEPSIAQFFVDRSVPDAHGRNVVNVILVDFRALDTLGEITVLAIAAFGVYAMLKLPKSRE